MVSPGQESALRTKMTRPGNSPSNQSPLDGLRAVSVTCYAGHRGNRRPRRYAVGEEEYEIDAIIAEEAIQWQASGRRYTRFIVSDRRSRRVVLWHDQLTDQWFLDEEM